MDERFDTRTGAKIDPWKRIAALKAENEALRKERDELQDMNARMSTLLTKCAEAMRATNAAVYEHLGIRKESSNG